MQAAEGCGMMPGGGVQHAVAHRHAVAVAIELAARHFAWPARIAYIGDHHQAVGPHSGIEMTIVPGHRLAFELGQGSGEMARAGGIADVDDLHAEVRAGDEAQVARHREASGLAMGIEARQQARLGWIAQVDHRQAVLAGGDICQALLYHYLSHRTQAGQAAEGARCR